MSGQPDVEVGSERDWLIDHFEEHVLSIEAAIEGEWEDPI